MLNNKKYISSILKEKYVEKYVFNSVERISLFDGNIV